MANLKVIAAIAVSLLAIVFAAEASKNLGLICKELKDDMSKELSSEDQAIGEKAYSFANLFISRLEGDDKQTADELLNAWDRVLHQPHQCDASSLRYTGTIGDCWPQGSNSTRTLAEAAKEYAQECLTPGYIEDKIKSQVSSYTAKVSLSNLENIVGFINDQFIDFYWSKYPYDKQIIKQSGMLRSAEVISKALVRRGERLEKKRRVQGYLQKHLYEPCFQYSQSFRDVMNQISSASNFLKEDYQKLISSLSESTQRVVFRYYFCTNINNSMSPEDVANHIRYILERKATYGF